MIYWTWVQTAKIFANFWTPLKPVPGIGKNFGGLDPSPIYYWKAQKLLYIHHISDHPDAHLTCLRSVTYTDDIPLKWILNLRAFQREVQFTFNSRVHLLRRNRCLHIWFKWAKIFHGLWLVNQSSTAVPTTGFQTNMWGSNQYVGFQPICGTNFSRNMTLPVIQDRSEYYQKLAN